MEKPLRCDFFYFTKVSVFYVSDTFNWNFARKEQLGLLWREEEKKKVVPAKGFLSRYVRLFCILYCIPYVPEVRFPLPGRIRLS